MSRHMSGPQSAALEAAREAGATVVCVECGEEFRGWRPGGAPVALVPAHGPRDDRCPGGGKPEVRS